MNIHFRGFRWLLPGVIKMDELAAHLEATAKREIRFRVYNRMLFVGWRKGMLVGVWLTAKRQSKVTEVDLKSYRVSVQKLREGRSLADINFFAVNPVSAAGLYTSYHQSPGVGTFCDFMTDRCDEFRDKLRKAEEQRLMATGTAKSRAVAAARKKYNVSMAFRHLYTEDDLPGLLASLDRIKSMQFDLEFAKADGQTFYPEQDEVNRERVFISFSAKASRDSIRKNILEMIRRRRIKVGQVRGAGPDGDVTVYLENTPESFGAIAYDEAVNDQMVNYEDIGASPLACTLVQRLIDNQHHFGDAP